MCDRRTALNVSIYFKQCITQWKLALLLKTTTTTCFFNELQNLPSASTHRGVARDFIMLKPTIFFRELGDIWPSYFTFQIANNKGADQTAWSAPLLFTSNNVNVARVEAHMMLKLRLPGRRLATHLTHIVCILFKKLLICLMDTYLQRYSKDRKWGSHELTRK